MAGGRNQGFSTIDVAIQALNEGRRMRFQSFNRYRIHFGLKPYESFEQLTGNFSTLLIFAGNLIFPLISHFINIEGEKEMAAELEELYGDIDGLELYTGLILEKRQDPRMFGETITEMGAPYSLKGTKTGVKNTPTVLRFLKT